MRLWKRLVLLMVLGVAAAGFGQPLPNWRWFAMYVCSIAIGAMTWDLMRARTDE